MRVDQGHSSGGDRESCNRLDHQLVYLDVEPEVMHV